VGKWVSTGAYPYYIAGKYMIGYLVRFFGIEKVKHKAADYA